MTAPASAVVPSKAQAFVLQCWELIMDMLRLEAREALTRDAEMGVSQGKDASPEALRWYGITITPNGKKELEAKIGLLELQMKSLAEKVSGEMIRRNIERATELAHEYKAIEEQIHRLDDLLYELDQQTEAEIEHTRLGLVELKALELKEHYLALSTAMPFNWNHPAIPTFLRNWLIRQKKRGAFTAEPVYRLLAYLVVRETVFTGIWNQPPVIEDEDLPSDNPLVNAGMPASKKEARWQALLDSQFMHATGDTRTHRETQLGNLHEARLVAVKQGKSFHDKMDLAVGPDYHGLPSLPNLLNPEFELCSECGSQIKDNVVRETTDETGAQAWHVVDECDCGQFPKSEKFALRVEAFEAQRELAPKKPRRRAQPLAAA